MSEHEEVVERSAGYEVLSRLLFPLLCLGLGVVYASATWGMPTRSLQYPYLVIAVLFLLTISTVAEDLLEIHRTEYQAALADSLRSYYTVWNLSIYVAVGTVVYVVLITSVGFIVASFLVMVALMYLSGERNALVVGGVTAIVLALVYVVFIQLIGLSLPRLPVLLPGGDVVWI